MQKHNQQLTKQNKSIGLVRSNFTKKQIDIYTANLSLKRIKDFNSNKEINQLIDLIGKWRFYIGIKEELSQEEIFMNVSFIRENFEQLNLFDIKQAIDLSIKGALNVDVEHYQNFSPLYISKILNAYKKHKGEVVVTINQKIREEEQKQIVVSNQDKLALTKASIKTLYQEKDNPNFFDGGSVTYNFIKRNKLFPLNDKLVKEALEYGQKVASSGSRSKALAEAFSENPTKFKDLKEKKEIAKRKHARNYIVIKWLNSIENIDEFLKSITINMI